MFGLLKSSPLRSGATAPDFTLPDENGEPVRLYDVLKTGPTVLYFYPKAFTAVCTAEVCGFRDSHDAFRDAGANVFGISTDDVETQRKFKQKYRLNHSLLSDADGSVHELFGLRRGPGVPGGSLLNDRVTFVIDGDGIVRDSFGGRLVADPHVQKSLRVVQELVRTRA